MEVVIAVKERIAPNGGVYAEESEFPMEECMHESGGCGGMIIHFWF